MRYRILGLVCVLALTATAAMADETPYEPTFERQDAWFHPHTLPVGNLDASEGDFVRWDDEEPTGPIPAVYHGNNYGGILDGDHTPEHFFTAAGSFTGDLDTLAFDMYLHGWAQALDVCPMSLSFDLRIDNRVILFQDMQGSDGFTYEQAGRGVTRMRFALTNIWEAFQRRGIAYGPDVEHDVYVNIQNFYLCNEVTWLYGAADTPAGLTANLPDPAEHGYFEVDVLNPPPPLPS